MICTERKSKKTSSTRKHQKRRHTKKGKFNYDTKHRRQGRDVHLPSTVVNDRSKPGQYLNISRRNDKQYMKQLYYNNCIT